MDRENSAEITIYTFRMKGYTVGFIFDSTLEHVALVTKTHPAWQKGKVNGVGGLIDADESSVAGMVREAKEEAGITTTTKDWEFIIKMKRPDLFVDFYTCRWAQNQLDVDTQTDEAVMWYPVSKLPVNVIPNLRWMIPFALDTYPDSALDSETVTYTKNND